MRPKLRFLLCHLALWLPLGAAVAAVLAASFGSLLGLDPDLKWGGVRLMVLGGGLAVLGIFAADRILARIDLGLLRRNKPQLSEGTPPVLTSEPITGARSMTLPRGQLALFFLTTIFIYLGLATVWNWPRWPKSTYRYDSLAEAFAKGNVALSIQPSPALADLDNPYDPAAREGIQVISDLSYFDGRYYMYWGPTPAALSAVWLLAGGSPISDALIVFLSISVMFVFSALLVLDLQRKYFPNMPPWLVAGSLVLVATAHPALWTLNSPSIYTAAISSGQAFFVGGLYFMLTTLNAPPTAPWRHVACGTFWALAIGSRLTLLVTVGPLVLVVIALRLRAMLGSRSGKQELYQIGALLMPLALGGILLGAYNFARFGDALESGFRYQIVENDQGEAMRQGLVFNPRFLIPNLLHYLATPIRLGPEFPFVRPRWEAYPPFASFLARFKIPQEHSVQDAAGLIFVTPALLLGGPLLMSALSCPSGAGQNPLNGRGVMSASLTLRHFVLVLLLSGLTLTLPILAYRVSSIRFLMELSPVMAVFASLGAFFLYQNTRSLPSRRLAVISLITSAIALSALIGFLLALNGADSRFDDANPTLYQALVDLFSR
ncbi:MAG TPA: hypothetical protein VI520_07345 [Anaerolineales bacterium]|nr:hypothetical protein [Anaerolineales bacterium]